MDTGRDGVAINAEHLVFISMHVALLFPESTANMCILPAGATANEWSEWTEICLLYTSPSPRDRS